MAQVIRLDDYRKTPRGPVPHELAMDPDKAHYMREAAQGMKAEFLRRCASLKGE